MLDAPPPALPSPPPAVAVPTAPTPASKAAAAAGLSGGAVLIWLLDRLLVDGGEQAASMLTRLSPILGPAWASWPLLALVAVLAWVARDRWNQAQYARALEAVEAQRAAASLSAGVNDIAAGLAGLRVEVHSLRSDLRAHADATDARFVSADASLRDFVKSEVAPIAARVGVLEGRRSTSKSGPSKPRA